MSTLEEIKKALEGQRLEKWATHQGLRGTAIVVANDDGSAKRYSDDSMVFEIPTSMPENARYIAAVNPAAISELLSTLESLQRDLNACQEQAVKDGNEIGRLRDWQAGAISCREAEQARIDEYKARAEAAEAEVKRLQAEIDRKSSMPGDHRYWEGRYRDEAATNDKLREALTGLVSCHDDFNASSGNMEEAYYKLAKYAYPKWEAARTALTSAGESHD